MKRLLVLLVAAFLLIACVPASVFAAENTVTSKMYEIYVTGNYAFVSCGSGIYRVKLKKGKPVAKKRIYKSGKKLSTANLIVKGKYVYFKNFGNKAGQEYLYRVKKGGGDAVELASMGEFSEVAFKDNQIYYSYPGETDDNGMVLVTIKKVMNLDGTGLEDTDTEAIEKDKYKNKKGYKFAYKPKGKKIVVYLKTPKGKIALQTI